MRIIFASNNKGKIIEVKNILGTENVYSLDDIGYDKEIDEYGTTFHLNALIKAQEIAKKYPNDTVIADDSGLCVEALDEAPGVYSARYAKEEPGYEDDKDLTNNKKLLKVLDGEVNREAYFITVLCMIKPKSEPMFVSGKLCGEIANKISPGGGFGYDSIFKYKNKPVSQLTMEEKNNVSHRAKALEKIKKYI